MLFSPRITQLSDNTVNNLADEGTTCENAGQSCRELPEYRCELGPLDPGKESGNDDVKRSVNLCPTHAKKFAEANQLELPVTRRAFWDLFRRK
jgi:hypothetical protein